MDWQFSAVDSEMYPFDRTVVKAIRREVDKDFVPLVIRSVYVCDTGGLRHFEHHGIAWRITDPHKKHQKRRILWPTTPGALNYGMEGNALFLEDILRGKDHENNLPGEFQRIGWDQFHRLKAGKKAVAEAPSVEEETRQFFAAKDEVKAKAEKRMSDEIDYRLDHDEHFMKRTFLNTSGPEYDAMGKAPMSLPERKPFIDLGGNV